ncbi:MAG: undecaprenyldiphospho-muramoylpentapeptide beta-N-acetylglucosaminyltransferase [Deltaproteobacteria bacterium]|nr:undecaprenyldiphospho-muramoylpentapeptide beta-N-acetylglucosaminyltransferase [Deltaproteobacteria bacterium]
MKLVIAGGGTGGHLFPGIAVAEALRELDPSSEVLFVGTARGIETRAVPKAGYRLELIDVAGLKGMGALHKLKTLARLPLSLAQSRRVLRDFGADAVIGVGGYASGPVLVAARTLGLPTAICEQNSVPGVTNRMLGKIVDAVYVTFPASQSFFPAHKTHLTGNPVRASFRDAARRPAPPVEKGLVFTFGGSQGARPLNENVPLALGLLKQRGHDVRALHQAGKDAVDAVRDRYSDVSVSAEVTPFLDDMVTAYRRAHVVLCRAGATSCAELTALGVPAILVPFPEAADDHQTKNADDLVAQDAAILLPQADLTPATLADVLERLLVDDDHRRRLADGARRAGRLEAALDVARAAQTGFRAPHAQARLPAAPRAEVVTP